LTECESETWLLLALLSFILPTSSPLSNGARAPSTTDTMPRLPRPLTLTLLILFLAGLGVVLSQPTAGPRPPAPVVVALCGAGPEKETAGGRDCGGAAVVHPPPAAAAAAGYVDCVSPGAGSDARCVAAVTAPPPPSPAGGSVAAASVDEEEGAATLSPFTFPPADTAAVLAACPDEPLLPDALVTEGDTSASAGLPTQEALDAAAEQVRREKRERGETAPFLLLITAPLL